MMTMFDVSRSAMVVASCRMRSRAKAAALVVVLGDGHTTVVPRRHEDRPSSLTSSRRTVRESWRYLVLMAQAALPCRGERSPTRGTSPPHSHSPRDLTDDTGVRFVGDTADAAARLRQRHDGGRTRRCGSWWIDSLRSQGGTSRAGRWACS